MKKNIVDKLKIDSSFYGNDYFKYTVRKVYKNNNKVNGVLVSFSYKNIGIFSETKYISRKELLSDYYNDEFVEIEEIRG